MLAPNTAHNAKAENADSQNLLIQGDNLAVLKHLRKAYRNRVKMIYIDPPYNTGSDGFVYNDDRKYTPEQIAQMTGEEEEIAQRIFDFINRKASSHSAWLTFMYPRLKVARELLKEDGVIFISIDDNEQAQLKMLCDEVFGEENFVGNFLWKKKSTTSNVKDAQFSNLTDNTLCYMKSELGKIKPRIKEKETRKYLENDDLGSYRTAVIEKKDSGGYKRETMKYAILGKYPRDGKRWQIGEDKARELEKSGRFFWDGEKIKQKIYDFEDKDTFSARPNLMLDCGTTDSASKDLEALLLVSELFDNPKPKELIQEICSYAIDNNDLILDFFAGSGTTAHAVMQLNAEDGGNRNYICVQLDEPTDPKSEARKAGYNTIFEITKARIIKASENIQKENPDYKGGGFNNWGFKEFKLEPYPEGYGIIPENPQQAIEQGELFTNRGLDHTALDTILTTWAVNDGLPLTKQPQAITLNGKPKNYTAYIADNRLYLLDKGFNSNHLADLLAQLDDMENLLNFEKIIVFGHHFDSKVLREIEEAVNQYKARKAGQLYWETRYE